MACPEALGADVRKRLPRPAMLSFPTPLKNIWLAWHPLGKNSMPSCERAPCHLSRRRPALLAKKVLNGMKGICKGQDSQLEGPGAECQDLRGEGQREGGPRHWDTGRQHGGPGRETRWPVFGSCVCLSSSVTLSQHLTSLSLSGLWRGPSVIRSFSQPLAERLLCARHRARRRRRPRALAPSPSGVGDINPK